MKQVLIANSDHEEAQGLEKNLSRYFGVRVITNAKEWKSLKSSFDLILIDHNFTINSGIDFLMDIFPRIKAPVLMLTPDSDPQCAIEALRVGAFNYIVKTQGFLHFLNIAIDDAINKYGERQEMKETISGLRSRLVVLEDKVAVKQPKFLNLTEKTAKKTAVSGVKKAPPKPAPPKEVNLMEAIISRFKKGDVNLPTLPEVNLKFNDLVRQGANLSEVADFLRKDVAITSKLINVANSALYRGIEKTSRLEDAISKLGLGKTRQYVEIIANRSLYTSENKRFGSVVEKLWEHSLATAFGAEFILNLLHVRSDMDIFALGLTHDIGKLILIQVIGELEAKGQGVKKFDQKQVLATLKSYHGKFGAVLLNRWGFPQEFKDVAMYHDHLHKMENPTPEFLCVHFANLMATAIGYNIDSPGDINLDHTESGYKLRLRSDDIDLVKEKTTEYITSIRKAF